MRKFKIKKDDLVVILNGTEKGSQGKILKVLPKENRAIVEGVNKVSRHSKPNAANPDGGIIAKEAPIHLSNLMLVDPKSGEKTRVGFRIDKETGKKTRYSKKTGENIK